MFGGAWNGQHQQHEPTNYGMGLLGGTSLELTNGPLNPLKRIEQEQPIGCLPTRQLNECDDDEDYAPFDECALQKREYELFIYNLTFGCFQLLQAAIVLALGLGNTTLGKFKLPLTTLFTYWDLGYPQQRLVIVGFLPFVAATSGFAWQTAVAHFSVVIGFPCYLADLRRGVNRYRWVEYAFSSSWMICLIGLLFGIYDINTQVSNKCVV